VSASKREILHTDTGPFAEIHRAALFRATVRSLARDATQVLLDLRLAGDVPSESEAKLHLLHHYLDYLVRLCDGQV
jgi:poly-beta-hydroxyalkanoate depolymerase